jgi:hypothetical protein
VVIKIIVAVPIEVCETITRPGTVREISYSHFSAYSVWIHSLIIDYFRFTIRTFFQEKLKQRMFTEIILFIFITIQVWTPIVDALIAHLSYNTDCNGLLYTPIHLVIL